MSGKGYLDIVNHSTEDDIDMFVDTFEAPKEMGGEEFDPDAETGGMIPEFTEVVYDKIRINHGVHADDYVWHISPHTPKSSFTQPPDNIVRLCATIFSQLIPSNIQVDIFPPPGDWEIKEWTFKAHGLNDCWQVQPGDIEKTNIELGRVLSIIVDR